MSANRINGWKAIGGHFNRDRTTVMRWARERGLPVRRLPGGKTSTVYALAEELDQWAANQTDLNDEGLSKVQEVTGGQKPSPTLIHRLNFRTLGVLALAVLLVILGFGLWPRIPAPETRLDLPSDPNMAKIYLQARDEWAMRKPENIQHATELLLIVVEKDPKFALGWSGLADAYLLAREFDAMPDNEAFLKAKRAAQRAVALNPDLADAHRALGFIYYWSENKPTQAGKAFNRAIRLSPYSAQTHFWYGNILIDNGQTIEGLRELALARQIEPGSVAIQTDLAWAYWTAGDTALALQNLNFLAQEHPDFPVIYDCLSLIKLSDGDYVGYVQALFEYARLKNDRDLLHHAQELKGDIKIGVEAVQKRMMDRVLAEIKSGIRQGHQMAVLYASVAQDRKQVINLLSLADQRREVWGNFGITARIRRLWIDDLIINDLLDRRKARPVK